MPLGTSATSTCVEKTRQTERRKKKRLPRCSCWRQFRNRRHHICRIRTITSPRGIHHQNSGYNGLNRKPYSDFVQLSHVSAHFTLRRRLKGRNVSFVNKLKSQERCSRKRQITALGAYVPNTIPCSPRHLLLAEAYFSTDRCT